MNLKDRLERLEKTITAPIGKDSFIYRMAKEQDKNFSGDGTEAVSLLMQGLKADYETATGKAVKT